MKIIIEKENIIDGLQKALNILTRPGSSSLRSIWIKAENNKVSFLATDASMEFNGTYKALIEEEGIIGVQGRAFVELIRQLPNGKIKFTTDSESNSLKIEQERKRYKLPINDASWFQELSPFPKENCVTLAGDLLNDVFEKVSFCISDEDEKEAISCLCINKVKREIKKYIEICGLNGHQFALISLENEDLFDLLPATGILLQRKYLQELKKWFIDDYIELNLDSKRFYLRTPKNEILSLPLLIKPYIQYHSFLNKALQSTDILVIDRKQCIEALGRLSIFNTKDTCYSQFDLNNEESIVFVKGQDTGFAKENITIQYNGNLNKIAFNTKKLMETLSHFQSSKLNLQLSLDDGPCAITGKDDNNYFGIIMPIKVADNNYYEENA